MAAYLILFRDGQPIVDTDPQDGEGVRSVELRLDGRAAACLNNLLALASFEVAHALGALVGAGVALGARPPVVLPDE
jgi:hypothetical protein